MLSNSDRVSDSLVCVCHGHSQKVVQVIGQALKSRKFELASDVNVFDLIFLVKNQYSCSNMPTDQAERLGVRLDTSPLTDLGATTSVDKKRDTSFDWQR